MILQRRAQVRRRDGRHVGEYGVKFVLGDFQRNNCGRQIALKGCRDINDLSETWMRVADVKPAEPVLPIRKRAQQGKRRGLFHAVHPVGLIDDVTPPTVSQGQCFARDGVSLERHLGGNCLDLNIAAENRYAVRSETGYCALADVRREPLYKEQWSVSSVVRQRPHGIQSGKNHSATCPNDNIPAFGHLLNAHPMLERKTWQKVLQKPRINNRDWCRQGEGFILGCDA